MKRVDTILERRPNMQGQVVHLDMAESDPDLDQDFPKMSIS